MNENKIPIFRADLHCHTTFSDGSLTPTEIIYLAKEKKLQGLSITDHDTFLGYEEALPVAKECNIQLISGIECSSEYNDEPVHILGYAFSLNNPKINSFSELCQNHRIERNRSILKKLKERGMKVEEEELLYSFSDEAHKGSLGRPHIANLLVKKGYVKNIQDAFKRLLAEGKPCYTHGQKVSIQDTINIIHSAGGLACIAHPHFIKRKRIVKDLLTYDFDGIEVYYACFPSNKEKKWLQIARGKKWLATGGSDFHGMPKPHIPLGASWVSEKIFNYLHQTFIKNNPL